MLGKDHRFAWNHRAPRQSSKSHITPFAFHTLGSIPGDDVCSIVKGDLKRPRTVRSAIVDLVRVST
eukprot:1344165-Rhodomonas_salina.1